MIVLLKKRDGSEQWCMTEVERIQENNDLAIILVSDHSEDVVLDIDKWTLDIVGLG